MKLLIALVQPQQLPAVKAALFQAQIRHLSITNVLGTAPEGAELRVFRGVPHQVSLFQKVRIEIALREDMIEPAIEALKRGAAASGGYGIAFLTELHDAVILGSGARGEQVIQ
jgi:nitrogen regulatory protein P-II 1